MNRAELLQAVIAERWPDPDAAEDERPDSPAYHRRVLVDALADYGRRGRLPANPTQRKESA